MIWPNIIYIKLNQNTTIKQTTYTITCIWYYSYKLYYILIILACKHHYHSHVIFHLNMWGKPSRWYNFPLVLSVRFQFYFCHKSIIWTCAYNRSTVGYGYVTCPSKFFTFFISNRSKIWRVFFEYGSENGDYFFKKSGVE